MAKRASDSDGSAGTNTLGAHCRVVALTGKESFLRQSFTAELRAALVKEFGDVDTAVFDGLTAQPSDVLDEVRSFGLMSAHKLVIVDNADSIINENSRPLFQRYAEQPTESATLVFRSETWRPGKLDAAIEAVGLVKKCEPVDPKTALAWAMKRAKKEYTSELTVEAAQALVSRAGTGLAKLDSEIAKLSAAAASDEHKGIITPDLVRQFVGMSREEEVWGIQQTLLSAGPEQALAHLRYVLDVSRAPAQLVLWSLIDLSRKIHAMSRAVRQGEQPFAVSKALKLWGPSEQLVIAAGKRVDPDRALAVFRQAMEADQRSKSGLGDVDRTLERLVLCFSAAMRNDGPNH